jgi:hypothetical protein
MIALILRRVGWTLIDGDQMLCCGCEDFSSALRRLGDRLQHHRTGRRER